MSIDGNASIPERWRDEYACIIDGEIPDAVVEKQLIEELGRAELALADLLDWRQAVFYGDNDPPAGGVYHRGRAALTQHAAKEPAPVESFDIDAFAERARRFNGEVGE